MIVYGYIIISKEIANMKQAYTQFGGARPFGVSVLFAGVDDENYNYS